MIRFTESVVEKAALDWLEDLGWTIRYGPEIAADMPSPERNDSNYRDVVLEGRLRRSLVQLNEALPSEALDDAFRRLARPEGPNPEARNRALHHWLVDGVTVEYRREDVQSQAHKHE